MRSEFGGLVVFLTLVLTVLVVAGGFWWAESERENILDRLGRETLAQAVAEGRFPVYRYDRLPDATDPFSSDWTRSPRWAVALLPQTIAMPMLDSASVESVYVQAQTDGEEIVWRMTWRDATPDMNVDTGRFCDAAALQFPLNRDVPFTMGAADKRVYIMHWKGLWQKDVDEHFQDVQDMHPNYWTDLYWFARGEFPYPVPEAFTDSTSHQWFTAYASGNPVANIRREQPVEELAAEGFGTLTTHRRMAARGAGAWEDGWWAVVFRRPLHTEDPLDFQFARGRKGELGVAVWEGSGGNVGGRKHYSNWIPFEVQS